MRDGWNVEARSMKCDELRGPEELKVPAGGEIKKKEDL